MSTGFPNIEFVFLSLFWGGAGGVYRWKIIFLICRRIDHTNVNGKKAATDTMKTKAHMHARGIAPRLSLRGQALERITFDTKTSMASVVFRLTVKVGGGGGADSSPITTIYIVLVQIGEGNMAKTPPPPCPPDKRRNPSQNARAGGRKQAQQKKNTTVP